MSGGSCALGRGVRLWVFCHLCVPQVDYGATAEELEAHFHGCGSVNRVTILCDKFTGHPKGYGPRPSAFCSPLLLNSHKNGTILQKKKCRISCQVPSCCVLAENLLQRFFNIYIYAPLDCTPLIFVGAPFCVYTFLKNTNEKIY